MAPSSQVGKIAVVAHCPPALAEARAQKKLVVLCGAGISMAPPSAVPSWSGFNEALFGQVKARAAMLPGLSSEATKILLGMTVIATEAGKDAPVIPTEGFSDTVVDLLLSDAYFPALQVLDGERGNANHEALAWLAKEGAVRAIVTTNFDTLLERGLREAGVDFDKFISSEDYERDPGVSSRLGLYKIHGSVDAPDSLKDTATQKLAGLPLYVRVRLAELGRQHHLLVLGFSGGDLKFGDNYLGFAPAGADGPGITWVVRPPKNPNDALVSERVYELLERAGERTAIVKGDLAGLFQELGVPAPKSVGDREDSKAAEEGANARAAQHLEEFFDSKALAPLRCASFCAHLLRGAGWSIDARIIEAALAAALQTVAEPLDPSESLDAAISALGLAKAACDDNEPLPGNDWALRGLHFAESAKARASPEETGLWAKLESHAWNARGLCFMMCNQFGEAADSLARAKSLLDPNGGELATLSMIQSNEAYAAWKAGASNEKVLRLIRRGDALARQAGNTSALVTAATFESLILIARGEYDVALQAIERGLEIVGVTGNAREKTGLLVLNVKVAIARGQIEPAFQQMQDLVGSVREHPGLAAGLFIATVRLLGFHPPFRTRLIEMADALLAVFHDGRIPVEGRPPNVPSRAEVEQIRNDLTTNRLPANDVSPGDSEPPKDREEELRRLIIKYESAGPRSELPKCFLELFELVLDESDPARLIDIAFGLRCAAEREHADDMTIVVCCQRMVAWQRAGQLRRALEEFEQLPRDAPAAAKPFAIIQHMAGSLHSLIGTQQEAESLLQSALALNRKSGNAKAAANDLIYLAVVIGRNGEYSRAIETLESQAHLFSESSAPAFSARRDQLLDRFRRRQAHRGGVIPISIGLNEPLRRARLTAADMDRLHLQVASADQLLMLARFALGSDQPKAARALTLDASVNFGELRDERGIADCLSFLADIAETEGQWEKAYEFNRMASGVCARLEDPPREIASLAALAFTLHKLGDSSEAGQAATRCLLRAEGSQPSRPLLIACFVRAASCEQSGDLLGKIGAISTFVSIYPAVSGVDDLKPVRDSFARLLTPAAK